jgi:hypothetical protein
MSYYIKIFDLERTTLFNCTSAVSKYTGIFLIEIIDNKHVRVQRVYKKCTLNINIVLLFVLKHKVFDDM